MFWEKKKPVTKYWRNIGDRSFEITKQEYDSMMLSCSTVPHWRYNHTWDLSEIKQKELFEMENQKQTCGCFFTTEDVRLMFNTKRDWQFCPMCGKPLKESATLYLNPCRKCGTLPKITDRFDRGYGVFCKNCDVIVPIKKGTQADVVKDWNFHNPINNPMNEEKPIKQCCGMTYSSDDMKFCMRCGKPLKEKEWEPEDGGIYYYINCYHEIEPTFAKLQPYDKPHIENVKKLHEIGNLFTSREQAEKHLAMIKCVDSGRELPYSSQDILQIAYNGDIFRCQFRNDALSILLWRLGFAQPDTPEGRALLEKNIREHKEWFV